jgi:hypothetical protein
VLSSTILEIFLQRFSDLGVFSLCGPHVDELNEVLLAFLTLIFYLCCQQKQKVSDMVKTVELSRIKTIAQLKALLKKVQKESDQYLLEQEGEAIAALVPPAQLEAIVAQDIEAAKKEVRAGMDARERLFRIMDAVQAKNLDFSEDEVERDIMAAREEIRQGHG